MLEVSDLRIPAASLPKNPNDELNEVKRRMAKGLGIKLSDILALELRRRAIDARRGEVRLVYTLRFSYAKGRQAEEKLLSVVAKRRFKAKLRQVDVGQTSSSWPEAKAPCSSRPLVVGAGAAGLFCALALARAGFEPLLIERGDDATRRKAAVTAFERTGVLDVESNIQFGLGGAGTFSDGKLATGTKSPSQRLVLETFVAAGASPNILYDAHPHVGSDVLPLVVTNLVREIERLGGEVRTRTRLTGITIERGSITGATIASTEGEDRIACETLVLATGHSARDVFELLNEHEVPLERKAFAMGVRIEHLQAEVDRAQYAKLAGSPLLGAAPYKLVEHLNSGRSCYSFCMCPGGFVMAAASEAGGVVTNGMSLSDRGGANANAGLLVNVTPADMPGDSVLAGVELQRTCERAAFELGGGEYRAPSQLVGDFLQGVRSSGADDVVPTYPRGVTFGTLEGCLPAYVLDSMREALPHMGRKLAAYKSPSAVLTGVETRSSSPVRVTRGQDLQSVGVKGLYPVGEGAGYAGGIMSAACDGIRAAKAIVGTR